MSSSLLQPLRMGDLNLKHRVIMAPLTRMRAAPDGTPGPLTAQYYAQRASEGGLLISESTQISQQGAGYPGTPGQYTEAHVAAWKSAADAVHAKGGLIFNQLVHAGRISHTSHQKDGEAFVGPSAEAAEGVTFTKEWATAPFETPRALRTDEMAGIVEQFKHAATCAKRAGFDGIEVHGANGYLLDQFLQDNVNKRTDEYGGSIENRTRLLLEVIDGVLQVWPKGRVGVRLSPYGLANGTRDSNPSALFKYAVSKLADRKLAYLHFIEPRATMAGFTDENIEATPSETKQLREIFGGPVIAAGGFNKASGEEAIRDGLADAIAYGRFFIANPDLPARFARGVALTPHKRETFYGGAEVGYTDYPVAT